MDFLAALDNIQSAADQDVDGICLVTLAEDYGAGRAVMDIFLQVGMFVDFHQFIALFFAKRHASAKSSG